MNQAGLEGCSAGFRRGVGVAEHGDRRVGEGHRLQFGGKGFGRCRHEGRVEGATHRQGNGPFAGELAAHGGHRLRRAGEHHLGAAVVVGDHHPFAGGHQGLQLAPVEAHHGSHGATAGGGHQGAAGLHQRQAGGEVEHPGHVQGHQLTEAVAGHHLGRAPLGLERFGQQAFDHEQGRLGVAGVVEVGEFARGTAAADGQQIPPQQVRGLRKALLGAGQVQHGVGHAHFL